ncbi:MAG: IPT/TIG domain-containing protein [Blastocatellia bacterium]
MENEYAVDSEVKGFELIRLRGWRLFGWSILIAGILFLLIRRAIKTDLLRDPHPVEWGKRRPYSLSQCQAAWWFALILTSFTFIYLVTGQFDISASALILLGIGFGTAVGASMIDEGRQETDVNNQPNNGKLQDMLEEKARIEMELNNLSITRRALLSDEEKKNLDEQLKAKEAEAKAKVQEISNEFPNAIRPGSEGLRKDILTDANGARFHRYQMAAWTFILGIIFLQQVLSRLAMPKFSETVLALMGISAGTFLGLKTTEQHNTQAPPGGDNGGSPPAQPARVERLTPNAGVQAGGDTVEIAGSGFVSGASVTFGGVAATVSAVEATKITVTTPAHAAGAVDVIVTNPDKAGAKLANGFTY